LYISVYSNFYPHFR